MRPQTHLRAAASFLAPDGLEFSRLLADKQQDYQLGSRKHPVLVGSFRFKVAHYGAISFRTSDLCRKVALRHCDGVTDWLRVFSSTEILEHSFRPFDACFCRCLEKWIHGTRGVYRFHFVGSSARHGDQKE